MEPLPERVRYGLVDGVRVEALGDAWAAYSPLSGETLVLNTEATALLEHLSGGAADEAAVSAALALDAGADPAEVKEALRHTWGQLTGAGLVEAIAASEHNPG